MGPSEPSLRVVRLTPELEPDVWAVSYFVIAPRQRGRGLTHVLLAEVLRDLQARRVKRVQGFPRRGDGLPADDVWTGPEATFRRAGFTLLRDAPRLPIYEMHLGG